MYAWLKQRDLSPEEAGGKPEESSPDSLQEDLPPIEPGELTPGSVEAAAEVAAEALVEVKALEVEALAGVLEALQAERQEVTNQLQQAQALVASMGEIRDQMALALADVQAAQAAEAEKQPQQNPESKKGLARLVPTV